MITLSFYQDTRFDTDAIPQQWRQYVSQQSVVNTTTGKAQWLVNFQVQPEDSSYRYQALMQKPQLVLKFSLPFYFEFPVGSLCTYQNQRFILTRAQDLIKQGTRKIEYTMTLGTSENYFGEWKIRNVVDPVSVGVPKDNRLKFSLCAKPHEFIDLIVRNLNNKDTFITWQRGECIDATEKTVEFNHTYIEAALTDICNAFQTEYEVEYLSTTSAKIHLHRVEKFKDSPVALSYGIGNGFIPGVGRTSETSGVPVKRMLVQGSDRNIDHSKYGAPELLLPKSQTIRYDGTHFEDEDDFDASIARTYQSNADGDSIERIDKISDATKEDSLDCSEIYPSRVGVVTSVVVANVDKNFYDIIDATIPDDLNFNNYLIAGETMTLIFQDGMLAGKEFDVKYKHAERKFEIVPQEIDGIVMPNATFAPYANADNPQHYAIFGIQLPDEYICNNTDKSGGSWDMMRAAVKALYESEDQRFTFTGSLQALWAKRHWLDVGGKLVVGGYVLFKDEQFAKDGVVIRIVGIKDFLTQPYSPTIELSNSVSSGSSVSSQIRQITNTEVVIEDTEKRVVQYTKRRFRNTLETLGMLKDAHIGDFTGSVSPVAIQTMAMLAGDESLQFRFVRKDEQTDANGNTSEIYTTETSCISYDNGKKQLLATMKSDGKDIYLQHLTLGQNAIMTQTRRAKGTYLTWSMSSWASPVLDDPKQSYYLYAKVSSADTTTTGMFVLSEKAISLDAVDGYYHLLCGVLNSELEGERSYVSLYGFTEVLPGRITTDLLISNDGRTYFDLEKGEIGGTIKFLSDNGYITILDGGKIKTELIDASQIIAKSLIVGEVGKQRIEIQPDSEGNGSVKIFDKTDNECAVFEGQSYTGITDLYDGSTGADCEILKRTSDGSTYGYSKGITLGRGSASHNASTDINSATTDKIELSKVWHTGTPTEVEMKTGKLRANAYSAGYTQTSGGSSITLPTQVSTASAKIVVLVETYTDYDEASDTLTNKVHSANIAIASAQASARVSYNYDASTLVENYEADSQTSGIIDIAGKKVRIPAGYHRLFIYVDCSASHNGSYANVSWGYTDNLNADLNAKWVCDFYVSRYFANGFCLGTRKDNYILAYKTDEGMRFVMENSNYGFDFSKTGIRTRAMGSTTKWMPVPMLLFSGYYVWSNSSYKLDKKLSFTDDAPTITRNSVGVVTLAIPESWRTALGTLSVQNLLVQVNGIHQTIDARVFEISNSSIKIGMSDDSSMNDGNFNIVIYYLPLNNV